MTCSLGLIHVCSELYVYTHTSDSCTLITPRTAVHWHCSFFASRPDFFVFVGVSHCHAACLPTAALMVRQRW